MVIDKFSISENTAGSTFETRKLIILFCSLQKKLDVESQWKADFTKVDDNDDT